MGHYASEMSPTWSKDIDRTGRQIRLKKELEDVPVGAFPCSELKPLMKVLDVYYGFAGRDPTHEEMDIIEARLKKIQSEA